MSDWSHDPAWRAFAGGVLADMLPKLTGSALAISLVPEDGSEGDVKYWVELGASIMLDKPIVVVCAPGRQLPEHLVRVADKVLEVDLHTDEGQRRLAETLTLLIHAAEEEGRIM